MGKGTQKQTTTQKAEPWKPATPFLKDILTEAKGLYEGGQLAQLAGFTPDQQAAFQGVSDLAGQPGVVGAATGTLTSLMDPTQYSQGLEAVKQQALSSAIPAAVAQFAGAGLTDSSVAQQEVGLAATQAVAPIEYQAQQAAQNIALQAAGLAPALQAAQYAPFQYLSDIGGQQQQQEQAQLDLPFTALNKYANLAYPAAGFGGTQSGTQSQSSSPGFGSILGAGLQALPFLFGLSDRRLKRNIRHIGETPKGDKLYEFSYLWNDETHVGVMADEVPHAIAGHIGPYAVVDYGKIL